MTVSPFRAKLLDDRKSLYDLLAACQATARAKEHAQVVSVSFAIPALDPLTVFAERQQPDQLHFYWELRSHQLAIAAFDPILHLKVDGSHRFTQAQQFICSTLVDTLAVGRLEHHFAGPHFFCSFTFFDDTPAPQRLFPAATIFLPRWHIARAQDQGILVANALIEPNTDLGQLTEQMWQQWQWLQTLPSTPLTAGPHSPFPQPPPHLQNTAQFTTAVTQILKDIQAQHLQKLVLAHTLDVARPTPLQTVPALATLRQRYANCYVFSVGNGNGQTFIGASPERLIALHDQTLTTEALAGSAPRGATLTEDIDLGQQLRKNPKDTHEHRVVLDFIQDCLWQLGIPSQLASPSHLLRLANIQHLRTLVTAQVPEHLHLLEILAALHPTPAVAGVPRAVTQQEIRQHERFERHLYAAPLGWVDYQGNGEFTVGIRSALIDGCCTRLYAGAGIVAGSAPQRELTEIQLKLHTLLEALML